MAEANVLVRKVTPDDNFERIRELMQSTKQRFYNDPRLNVVGVEEFKEKYVEPSNSFGFVAEKDKRMIGFMGVGVVKSTQNGYLEYGVEESESEAFESLLHACSEVIQKRGGHKLYYFATTSFGQVRNQEITLYERHGFISDEYSQITTHLSLKYWKEPDSINTSGIVLAADFELNAIVKMLIDDGEEPLAKQFNNQYSDANPDVIVLSLLGPNNEIAGVAYYKVKRIDPRKTDLSAVAFGVHFRPQYNVNKADKRRLIQAALLSMRQLNVIHAHTNMTLKNFDTFALMIREGFDDYLANSLRLVKSI